MSPLWLFVVIALFLAAFGEERLAAAVLAAVLIVYMVSVIR